MRIGGFAVATASIVCVAACASQKPPARQPMPVRVEYPYPSRVFRGAELDEMRARVDLAGVAYGTGCYCMPTFVVRGEEPEGTNLRGPDCAGASLAPGDSPRCIGLDPHGIEQEGRYLCLKWELGPSIHRNPSAGSLD